MPTIKVKVVTQPRVRIKTVPQPKVRVRATPALIPADGEDGAAATIAVGAVTTLPAGSPATVTNVGNENAAVFDFGIPEGQPGAGAVESVNGQQGVVVLDADDIDDTATTNKFATSAELALVATALQPSAIGVSVQAYDADLTAWAGVNPSSYSTSAQIAAAYQPLDADLTTIAGLTATTNNFIVSVSSAWASRTPAQVRTTLGLVVGTNVQAFDADLSSWAGVTRASGYDTFAGTPSSANLRALLTDEDGTGPALFGGSSYIREKLTGNRTYYVRTDGSDSNTGLVNNSGGAFLTIQKALDVAATIDFNGYTVTVQIGDGTYTGAVAIPVCVGQLGPAYLVLNGNSGTPANVIVSRTGGPGVNVLPNAMVTLQNFELRTTTSGFGLNVDGTGAVAIMGTGMRFGACSQGCIYVSQGTVACSAGYTVAGNSPIRVWAAGNGVYKEEFMTITYSGTPAFSTANIYARSGAYVASGASTQSGSATGQRYNVDENAVVATLGGGANFYPGNSAGTTGTTGVYS